MDRELLLEIGCEEIPASWLPRLTQQVGEVVVGAAARPSASARGAGRNLQHAAAADRPHRTACRAAEPISKSSSTVRRYRRASSLTGRRRRRPPDSPPSRVSRSPRSSAIETPKGEYLAFRKKQRGKAAVDVLPDVLAGTLRALTFPKLMRWDATLDDGKGELLFGRPIRWLLFLYGGRVVPFSIATRGLGSEPARSRTSRRAP